jgi:hypothetical protein
MSFCPTSENRTLKSFGLAAVILLFGLFDSAEAQSGRRAKKSQPTSIPAGEPSGTPAPTPASVATPDSPNTDSQLTPPLGSLETKVKLLIGRQPTRKHLQSEDVIFASFVNRLNSYPNVAVTTIGELKRQEAVIQAKGVTDSFVVLLTFEIDSFQGGTIILNSPDLQIEYQIIAPGTGKKLTNGKIYFQSIGGGRMRKSDWPGGTPIRITAEATGVQAADYVHDWLRLDEIRKLHTPA